MPAAERNARSCQWQNSQAGNGVGQGKGIGGSYLDRGTVCRWPRGGSGIGPQEIGVKIPAFINLSGGPKMKRFPAGARLCYQFRR